MAKHFTWCLRQTFLLANRLNVHQQFTPTLKASYLPIQSRSVTNPAASPINVDYDEPKDFDEFREDSKPSKANAAATLMKILSVARSNAKKAVEDYPTFGAMPRKVIFKNFQTLREGGFYKSTIKDNKFLLTDDSCTLKKKISLVEKMGLDINDAVALFQLPVMELSTLEGRMKMEASYLPASNRIVYLAEKLKTSISNICLMLSYNPIMIKIPAPKLLTVTEYLLEAGVAPEHILNDVQVYNYHISTIKEKIDRAKRIEVNPIKPWVLRCQKHIWDKLEAYHAAKQLVIRPDRSIPEHIQELFDCDMDSANYFVKRHPRVLKMDVIKLTQIVKFLREQGYKIEDIQRAPLILYRGFDSVQKRFNAWKQATNQRPSLYMFTCSTEDFEKRKALCSNKQNDKPS